ncbi:MAG: hypothetical protein GY853_01840 [PVC group bacterium]|nr:hypothetical protein [PVC group bacterium]
MAVDDQLTSTKLSTAKTHVYNVTQLGLDVTLIGSATKDEFGGILTESTIDLKAFPVRLTPYDRDVTRRISWAEDTDLIAYVSKKEIDDLGLTSENIRRNYKKIRHGGKTYELRYTEPYNAFGTDFLYYVLGGKA